MNKRLASCCLLAFLGVLTPGIIANGAVDDLPVVMITTVDGIASEVPSTDTGRFRVNRTGTLDTDLVVFYAVSGTATNGSDYKVLRGSVTIRAGRSSASIAVRAIDDTIPESDETVILTLSADASYTVGSPDTGTVTIQSNE